jgi:cell division septation protein DedD
MSRTLAVRGRGFILVLGALILCAALPGRARADTAYGIQVGSYQDLDNAVERVNYLKRLGYGAFYQYESVKGKGKWYRVYIARFTTLEKAREEARVLHDLGLIGNHDIRRLHEGASSPVKLPAHKKGPADKPRTGTGSGTASTDPKRTGGKVVYLLHVSSFKEREHAVEEARKLEKAGRKAFYVEEDLASGRWFRVYIGKYESEKAARAAGEQLKQQGLISYFKPLKIDRASLPDRE